MQAWLWDKIGRPILDWLADRYGSVIMSALLMLGGGFWAWSAEHEYLPVFLVGLGTFVAVIWGINGIIWLRSQQRPSKKRMTFDYSYGLALDEISPSHDLDNEENCLEFRFRIRNVAPGPLRHKTERMDAVIGDRIRTVRDTIGTLPRDSWILLHISGFNKTIVDTIPDRATGIYEYSIIYGHPEDGYSRRTKKRIHFDLIKKEGKIVAAPWRILEESDEPI